MKQTMARIAAATVFSTFLVATAPAQAVQETNAFHSMETSELNSQNSFEFAPVLFSLGINFGYGYGDSNLYDDSELDSVPGVDTHDKEGIVGKDDAVSASGVDQKLRGWSNDDDQIYQGEY